MKKIKITTILLSILTIGNYSLLQSTQQIFQPADGSMIHGTYNRKNNTAKTILHNYNNVISIEGTIKTPPLNALGKYVDKTGNQLETIGSFSQYANDSGQTIIYYLFGNLSDPEKSVESNSIENKPIETYDSQEN